MSVPEHDIPGYEYIRPLGQGGMASVHLFEHKALRRPTAIKFFINGPHSMQAFRFEAAAMGALTGIPNIATAFDAGITTSGVAYIAMPFYEGPTAEEWARSAPASENVVALALKVATALTHLHDRGIIHGDIKPSNILLSGGEPHLCDFGQAFLLDDVAEGSAADQHFTAFTPAYAAPELLTGDRRIPTLAGDVYSLAAATWSLLEGHPPRVSPGRSNDLSAMMRRAPRTEIPRVTRLTIAEGLQELLAEGLCPDPKVRPTSGGFAERLRQYERDLPPQPTSPEPAHLPRPESDSWWGLTIMRSVISVAASTPNREPLPRELAQHVSIDGVVAVLTALPEEMAAVTRHIRDRKTVTSDRGISYTRGVFTSNGRSWSVICACVGPGNITTAMVVQQTSMVFDLDLLAFVGVAGGIKDVKRGDVVVASRVIGYEAGKQLGDTFLPRPAVFSTDFRISQHCTHVSLSKQWRNRLPQNARGDWAVLVKPIVAGEKVLAASDSSVVQDIRRNHGDAVAVEMEGVGLYAGAAFCQSVPAVAVRGISDLLSGKRATSDAKWQPLAAATAAAFFFEVLSTLSPQHLGRQHQSAHLPVELTMP